MAKNESGLRMIMMGKSIRQIWVKQVTRILLWTAGVVHVNVLCLYIIRVSLSLVRDLYSIVFKNIFLMVQRWQFTS